MSAVAWQQRHGTEPGAVACHAVNHSPSIATVPSCSALCLHTAAPDFSVRVSTDCMRDAAGHLRSHSLCLAACSQTSSTSASATAGVHQIPNGLSILEAAENPRTRLAAAAALTLALSSGVLRDAATMRSSSQPLAHELKLKMSPCRLPLSPFRARRQGQAIVRVGRPQAPSLARARVRLSPREQRARPRRPQASPRVAAPNLRPCSSRVSLRFATLRTVSSLSAIARDTRQPSLSCRRCERPNPWP